MKTIKLPYKCNVDKSILSDLMNQQSNIVHIAYNRFKNGMEEKDVRLYIKI